MNDLRGSLFDGQAVLDNGTVIGARPSDALTLAVLLDAPIVVNAEVLEALAEGVDCPDRPPVDSVSYETASQIADEARELFGTDRADDDAPA